MKIKIFAITVVAIAVVLSVVGINHYRNTDINDKIAIHIDDLKVRALKDADIEYSDTRGYEMEDADELHKNMKDYKVIEVSYSFDNLSENVKMEDVRFYPAFDKEFSEKVVAYNSGNGNHYTYAEPGYGGDITQYIIIRDTENTAEQLYSQIKGQKIRLLYYAGIFGHNTGNGYTGIGSHSVEFKLK